MCIAPFTHIQTHTYTEIYIPTAEFKRENKVFQTLKEKTKI
jgi:hypothetical protein